MNDSLDRHYQPKILRLIFGTSWPVSNMTNTEFRPGFSRLTSWNTSLYPEPAFQDLTRLSIFILCPATGTAADRIHAVGRNPNAIQWLWLDLVP